MTDPREMAKELRRLEAACVHAGPPTESFKTAMQMEAERLTFLLEHRGEFAAVLERLAEVEDERDRCVAHLEEERAEANRLRARIAKLEAALKRWPCQHCYPMIGQPDCYECHGTGLHPVAREALGRKEET